VSHVITIAKGYTEASGVGGDYKRHLHPAKLLLARCDGDIEYCLEKVRACRDWARSKNVSWSLYTVLKHFHELKIGKDEQGSVKVNKGTQSLSDLLKGYETKT